MQRGLSILLICCAVPMSAAMLGGCAAIAPGDVASVSPASASRARAGNVYLLRGFIGIFSSGIDRLGAQINDAGVRATVFQDDQWSAVADAIARRYAGGSTPEPLVLIGHSYGADDVIRIARELDARSVRVDLLVTLDPVTPPRVPPNVRRCVNIFRSNGMWDSLPWLRGVPLECESAAATRLLNCDIRAQRPDLTEPGLDHFSIEKGRKIHDEIIRQVLATCPPRAFADARARSIGAPSGFADSRTSDRDTHAPGGSASPGSVIAYPAIAFPASPNPAYESRWAPLLPALASDRAN